jgi:hypothetical protein
MLTCLKSGNFLIVIFYERNRFFHLSKIDDQNIFPLCSTHEKTEFLTLMEDI